MLPKELSRRRLFRYGLQGIDELFIDRRTRELRQTCER